MKSIITKDMSHCYICHTTQNLETHHCLHGANRKKADKYGLVVKLCRMCHTGSKYSVHQNKAVDLRLQKLAQEKFEAIYGHKKFMEEFHKNYL